MGNYETCGRTWGGFGIGCAVTCGGSQAVAHRWVRVPHWYAAVVFGVVAMGRAAVRARR
jgi:Zn-dependent alcohol dehydrogenase